MEARAQVGYVPRVPPNGITVYLGLVTLVTVAIVAVINLAMPSIN